MSEYNTSMVAYWICTGFIIAKLTDYFQLPLGVSNMLTSLSSVFLVLQPLGGALYSKIRRKRLYLISGNLVWRISLCFVFFSVFLPHTIGTVIFCICLLSMQFFQQILSPAYEGWHVQAAEQENCSNFYAVREVVFMILYTVMAAVVQIFISVAENGRVIQQGFIGAGILESILVAISVVLILRLSAPTNPVEAQSSSVGAFAEVLRNKTHTKVIFANASWCFANVFIGGLFGIYAVRVLHVDFIQLMIWGTVGNLLRTVFGPVFTKIAARIGWRNCVSDIFFIYAFLAILLYFSTEQNAIWIVPVYLSLSTLPLSGFNIGTLKMRIASSSEELRSVYFSAFSLISGGASMLATMISSFLIGCIESGTLGIPLQSLFLVGLVLLILPFWIFRKIPLDLH